MLELDHGLFLLGKLFLVLMMTTDGKFSSNKLNLAQYR